jgi:hypothetical protein
MRSDSCLYEKGTMTRLTSEIKHDLDFVKSHTLQPRWYKAFKVFMVIAFLAAYYFFFGTVKTFVFFVVFIFLSFIVHLVYRVKTHRWTRSWLDFVVTQVNGVFQPTRIGKFYYSAVVVNAALAVIASQAVA